MIMVNRLDHHILEKLAEEIGKPEKYVREQISKRASRLGVSSEAAEILWARELHIPTARFQRKLPEPIQVQVRDLLPTVFSRPHIREGTAAVPKHEASRKVHALKAAIEYLLVDQELRERCSDLLRAKGNFDRVFREATTVLDDRLKRLAKITTKVNPAALAGMVLHPKNPLLRVSPDDDEQLGFYYICNGMFLAFRNPTHHKLSDKFTRQSALEFCGFVDSLLLVLGKTQIPEPT
jgi:hypothetical protein